MRDEPGRPVRLRRTLLAAATLLLLALTLRSLVQTYSVPSSSMEPTLLPGDHLVVLRYLTGQPRRGEVVVFDDGTGTARVKRVIGVGGDSVLIADGRVFVNGESLEEDTYALNSTSPSASVHVVPRDHLFLLGDNRDLSSDSRELGFVPLRAVLGHARRIYWSTVPGEPRSVRWSRLLRRIDGNPRVD